MTSVQVQHRREFWSFLQTFVPAVGEFIWDRTNRRVLAGDDFGTVGGIPVNGCYGQFGSFLQPAVLEGGIETITAGSSTYSSVLQIPANSVLVGVSARVVAAITGCTTFEIGISGTPNKFGNGPAVAAGSTSVAPVAAAPFTTATSLLLTSLTGGNFTGGTIRFALMLLQLGAPTS